VLTPHPGEFSRLVDMTRDEVLENRIDVAREFAVMHHIILVLKGAQSIVANYDGQVYINPTGNDGMATGGTGDVLAGMIGALLAQGIDPLASALIAVYVHGLSGDLARNKMGKMPMIASDLIDYLPKAWLVIRE
jgi:NAD(P)H-hydrate epimerase